VIADDVDGEALATLVVNNVQGAVKCAAVRAVVRDNYFRAHAATLSNQYS
jgi:chaperonin GroEL (HSP60 family)